MIDCSNVRFTYDGERFVLRGIDLHIADGEFVCILGGNGSGKSTLAKHMNALLVPDEGCVRVAGHDTQDEEYVYDIRSTAGMVFQNPDDQLVASLVEDDVAFGPENLGVESAHIAERVKQALKEVGLVGFVTKPTRFQAARSSASPLPACSLWSRARSFWTKPLRCSTPAVAKASCAYAASSTTEA